MFVDNTFELSFETKPFIIALELVNMTNLTFFHATVYSTNGWSNFLQLLHVESDQ